MDGTINGVRRQDQIRDDLLNDADGEKNIGTKTFKDSMAVREF